MTSQCPKPIATHLKEVYRNLQNLELKATNLETLVNLKIIFHFGIFPYICEQILYIYL